MAACAGFEGVEECRGSGGGEPECEGGERDVVCFGDRGQRGLGLGEVGDDAVGEGVVRVEVERGWRGRGDHEYG